MKTKDGNIYHKPTRAQSIRKKFLCKDDRGQELINAKKRAEFLMKQSNSNFGAEKVSKRELNRMITRSESKILKKKTTFGLSNEDCLHLRLNSFQKMELHTW